jgi:hypothetical protein
MSYIKKDWILGLFIQVFNNSVIIARENKLHNIVLL